jgi:hypothetical protein
MEVRFKCKEKLLRKRIVARGIDYSFLLLVLCNKRNAYIFTNNVKLVVGRLAWI